MNAVSWLWRGWNPHCHSQRENNGILWAVPFPLATEFHVVLMLAGLYCMMVGNSKLSGTE